MRDEDRTVCRIGSLFWVRACSHRSAVHAGSSGPADGEHRCAANFSNRCRSTSSACSSSTFAVSSIAACGRRCSTTGSSISQSHPKSPMLPPQPPGSPFRNMQLRKWRPVGPDEVVVMDKDQPFVGDQSPRIELDGTAPHGIRQTGLALVKGKKYTGRIYLRGTSGSNVKVSLIWGDGERDRQTISIGRTHERIQEVPAQFHRRRPMPTRQLLKSPERGQGIFTSAPCH